MSDVVHRSTVEYLLSVDTPKYLPPFTSDWIVNPDLSLLGGVPKKYWKVSGDDVLEMTQGEKDAVDAAEAATQLASVKSTLKTLGEDILLDQGQTTTVDISGLTLTVNTAPLALIVDDVTVVIADPTYTKYVTLMYVYNRLTSVLSVRACERTTEDYAPLVFEERVISILGEWSVGAGGTLLVKVT